MTLELVELRDLELAIGERIYLQISKWHLYLGDAGLAKDLAIECAAYFEQGSEIAARKALESLQVSVAGGKTSFPLECFVSYSQIKELEDILDPYCK